MGCARHRPGRGLCRDAQWLFNTGPLDAAGHPLLAQFPLALFLGLMGSTAGRRRGQRISKALSYYVPESVARDLTNNRSKPDAQQSRVRHLLRDDMSDFQLSRSSCRPDQLQCF